MDCINCECIICGEEFRAAKKLYNRSVMPAFGVISDAEHYVKGKKVMIHYKTFAYCDNGDMCPYCCTILTAVDIIQLVKTDPDFKKNLNNPDTQQENDETI
jgi:hypothetical protein